MSLDSNNWQEMQFTWDSTEPLGYQFMGLKVNPTNKIFYEKIDRSFATFFSVWLTNNTYTIYGIKSIIPLLFLIIFIQYSRMSPTQEIWIYRHTVWHIYCSIQYFFVMYHFYTDLSDIELKQCLSLDKYSNKCTYQLLYPLIGSFIIYYNG